MPGRHDVSRSRLRSRTLVMLVTLAVGTGSVGGAQEPQPPAPGGLPFFVGERLVYRVRTSRFGGSGKGEMTVEGPIDVRGTPTYVLRSTVETRVGLVKATNSSESWLDVSRMAALRFRKRERSIISSGKEAVELFPERRTWEADDGRSGESGTDAPLDELSFLYYLRTVPLEPDSTYRLERHFDMTRNPTTIRVVGREAVTTPAGRFETVLVEMRVKDPARYRGEGVIRINLTDDHCRLPVRIKSDVPMAGEAILTLERHTHPLGHEGAPTPARGVVGSTTPRASCAYARSHIRLTEPANPRRDIDITKRGHDPRALRAQDTGRYQCAQQE